jgi:hypothetical protein
LKLDQKNAFSGFCQKFPQAIDEVEIFFCQFPNPWALRVSGMGCYTSKCEKSQNHCTLMGMQILLAYCEKQKVSELEYNISMLAEAFG